MGEKGEMTRRDFLIGAVGAAALYFGLGKASELMDGQSRSDAEKLIELSMKLKSEGEAGYQGEWYEQTMARYAGDERMVRDLQRGLDNKLFGNEVVLANGKGVQGPTDELRGIERETCPARGFVVINRIQIEQNKKRSGRVENEVWARVVHRVRELKSWEQDKDPGVYSWHLLRTLEPANQEAKK